MGCAMTRTRSQLELHQLLVAISMLFRSLLFTLARYQN